MANALGIDVAGLTGKEIVAAIEAHDAKGQATQKQSDFGTVFEGYENKPEAAIEKLMAEKTGEVPNAYVHPELGAIAFVYGNSEMGLCHIAEKRGIAFLKQIPSLLKNGRVVRDDGNLPRAYIVDDANPAHVAVIRLQWNGKQKTWLITSFADTDGKFVGSGKLSNAPAQDSGALADDKVVFSQKADNKNSTTTDAKSKAHPEPLSSYTPADLQAKEEREQAADKAEQAEQKRLEDKAKADSQRGEFTLTGSDRAADVGAAAGQQGLRFSVAPKSQTQQDTGTQEQAALDAVRKQYEGTAQWMKAPNGKPTKLNERQWLHVRKGRHRGYGMMHMADNAQMDARRQPIKQTGDLAEDLMRQTVGALQGKVDIHQEKEGVLVIVNRQKGQAVVLNLQGGYYSVNTVRPVGTSNPTQLWGDPVLRNGRLAFPSQTTAADVSPQSERQDSVVPRPDRTGQGVRTEHFDFTKPMGDAQAPEVTVMRGIDGSYSKVLGEFKAVCAMEQWQTLGWKHKAACHVRVARGFL